MIYLSSDLHFGHDKNFIYKPRGFFSVQENDEIIVERFNSIVQPDDDLYLLGDQMLGDNEHGLDCLRQLNGNLHILWGNHDSNVRKELYKTLPNVVETLGCGAMLKYKKWHFLLSHYPTLTANYDDYDKPLKARVWNLHGHTHSNNRFEFMNKGWQSYNVAVDAHYCYPVKIDNIIEDIKWYYIQRRYEEYGF